MYVVHSTFKVPDDKVNEVIGIYRSRSKMVDDFKGFVSFQLLQNEKKPGELTVQLIWNSKENYLKWATSEAYKKVHDLEKNYPDQELASIIPIVSRYQVVAE